jgi:hypothetical protein
MAKKMTNYLAGKVAEALVQSTIGVERQKVQDQISEYVTSFILDHIPFEVIVGWKANPNYFNTSSTARLENIENSADCVYCHCKTHPATSSYNPSYIVAADVVKEAHLLTAKEYGLYQKEQEAKQQIKNALLQLSTFKRIKENFPEAFALAEELGVESSAALAIPIDSILDLLKSK